jgi:hypothetical protein
MRSLLGWIAVWVVVAVATGVAVWVVVNTIGHPQIHAALGRDTDETHHSRSTPKPEETLAVVETPAATPATTPEPTKETPREKPLHTEGVTVQILNGTMQKNAGQAMADRLSGLGYSIVAVQESIKVYANTTVFWSSSASRGDAEALADRFGWVAQPKPGNLSPDVSMHVVVGADSQR